MLVLKNNNKLEHYFFFSSFFEIDFLIPIVLKFKFHNVWTVDAWRD